MKCILVANWKMNPVSASAAKKLFAATRKVAEKSRKTSIIITPPAIFLRELSSSYRGSKVAFGVQDAHFETHGAHTGEISLVQAKDARARSVILGHAERRERGETDDDVRQKVTAALALKMTPIVCVGELVRTDEGEQFDTVREQLRVALADVAVSALNRVLIVYEPRWTIGTKHTMNPREMHQMAIFMRKCVVDSHGERGRKLKILYGGSVDESNVRAMLDEGDVHGLLVGRASINAVSLEKLVHAIEFPA